MCIRDRIDLLRRPQLTYADLTEFDANRPDLPAEVREQVEITVKYEGLSLIHI